MPYVERLKGDSKVADAAAFVILSTGDMAKADNALNAYFQSTIIEHPVLGSIRRVPPFEVMRLLVAVDEALPPSNSLVYPNLDLLNNMRWRFIAQSIGIPGQLMNDYMSPQDRRDLVNFRMQGEDLFLGTIKHFGVWMLQQYAEGTAYIPTSVVWDFVSFEAQVGWENLGFSNRRNNMGERVNTTTNDCLQAEATELDCFATNLGNPTTPEFKLLQAYSRYIRAAVARRDDQQPSVGTAYGS